MTDARGGASPAICRCFRLTLKRDSDKFVPTLRLCGIAFIGRSCARPAASVRGPPGKQSVMLHELDNTIVELLKRKLNPELAASVSFSFATPSVGFPPPSLKLPAINLFLYSATPNVALRENAPIVQRAANGTASRTRPPIYVDCTYLVSVWPEPTSKDVAADEHSMFGEVLAALLASPVIPEEDLQGKLQTTQGSPMCTKVSQGAFQGSGDVWQALGAQSKLSLVYTVTLSLPVFDAEPVSLVTEKQFRFRTLEVTQ
jgi:hypothetical protein